MFQAVILVGAVLLAEVGSGLAVWILHGPPAEVAELRSRELSRDPVKAVVNRRLPVMIHPYLGAVLQPTHEGDCGTGQNTYRITDWGFLDDRDPIRKRSDDRVIVAILGGSVARQLAFDATDVLQHELSQVPEFAGRKFEFVRLAVDGYKQPQQLMAVNYLMTLGAEFDVVINLDGVNDAALPKMDNVPTHVAVAYPRKWGTMVTSADSPEFARLLGYVTYLRHKKRDWAAAFDAFPWRHSMTGLLIWRTINDRRDREIFEQLEELDRLSVNGASHCASGPPEAFASDAELYERCVEIWARSSIQLHQLCAANGARYFHFLQPNQHVEPPTKPFSPGELAMLTTPSPFRDPVRQCYPLMRASADRLSRAGVAFTDLTHVFSHESETIYTDSCCHMTSRGDEIMARAIGRRIRELSSR